MENLCCPHVQQYLPHINVNDCCHLFLHLGQMTDDCPLTKDGLLQHVWKTMLQSYICTCCTVVEETVMEIGQWVCKIDQLGNAQPTWTMLLKASWACKELRFADVQNSVLVKLVQVNWTSFHALNSANVKGKSYCYTLLYIHILSV